MIKIVVQQGSQTSEVHATTFYVIIWDGASNPFIKNIRILYILITVSTVLLDIGITNYEHQYCFIFISILFIPISRDIKKKFKNYNLKKYILFTILLLLKELYRLMG